MAAGRILVLVDGRDVVLPRDGTYGAAIMAAVGATADRGDFLVRVDGGSARLVASTDLVTVGLGALPTFRVHRGGEARQVEVDGHLWEWGSTAIDEGDIRLIAGIPDGSMLLRVDRDGELIPPGVLVDLDAGHMTVVASAPKVDPRVLREARIGLSPC